jgi:hypothetical protein
MFNPDQLVETALIMLSPYLAEAAKGAASKAGEEAYEGGKKLLSLLRKIFKDHPKALEQVQSDPANPESLAALRISLSEMLAADPSLQQELGALLQEITPLDGSQNLAQNGNENVAVQTAGSNNRTIIRH